MENIEKQMNYQDINAKAVDNWCVDGWSPGQPISHEEYINARNGNWSVSLTTTKAVPRFWFGELRGKQLLGLASGGGQQIPIFAALGAHCTVLDYSEKQCESEYMVAQREGYDVTVIRHDMTKTLPFADETFDIIFHPLSNMYVEDAKPIFKECYRILKTGGILLCGLDNGINFIFDDSETEVKYALPFNPLKNEQQYADSIENDWGIEFSHTLEEQIGGQLEAGFVLTHVMEDVNAEGKLHDYNIPTCWATRAVKK